MNSQMRVKVSLRDFKPARASRAASVLVDLESLNSTGAMDSCLTQDLPSVSVLMRIVERAEISD